MKTSTISRLTFLFVDHLPQLRFNSTLCYGKIFNFIRFTLFIILKNWVLSLHLHINQMIALIIWCLVEISVWARTLFVPSLRQRVIYKDQLTDSKGSTMMKNMSLNSCRHCLEAQKTLCFAPGTLNKLLIFSKPDSLSAK